MRSTRCGVGEQLVRTVAPLDALRLRTEPVERVLAPDTREELLDRYMPLAAQKDVDDRLALRGGLEALRADELHPLRLKRLGVAVLNRRRRHRNFCAGTIAQNRAASLRVWGRL